MHKASLAFNEKQTRLQSILVGIGLVYLAVPNFLFLWGWFAPKVSLPVSFLILWAVIRAIRLSFRDAEKASDSSDTLALAVGILVTVLVSFYFLFRAGLLGFVVSYGDLEILRNAMFANLRDAPWPLILPNGKEMTYYLANVLPPAMLARLAPNSGQWPVVLWTLTCMLLIISIVASLIKGKLAYGWKMSVTSIFLGVVCCSYFIPALSLTLRVFNYFSHLNVAIPSSGHPIILNPALSGCGGVYNSFPPALLLTSILLICRNQATVVLPLALALTVPLSPFVGIGLLPFVIVLWCNAVREKKKCFVSLLPDLLVPLSMAILCAVYFLRADGETSITLAPIAWGWKPYIIHEGVRIIGWLTLVLPLFFYVKKDAFFYTFLACYILMPSIFIGTLPAPGEGRNNELWLKVAPCYMLMTVTYWLLVWRSVPWYKYLLMGACLLMTVMHIRTCVANFGTNGYLEVDDRWNGHMNHDDTFFNQSLPRCKTPIVPGIMLRNGGESERCFPCNLLPKAPGCDYSRPARPEVPLRWW